MPADPFIRYLQSLGYTRAQIRLFDHHPERIASTFGDDVANRLAADVEVWFEVLARKTAGIEATIWN